MKSYELERGDSLLKFLFGNTWSNVEVLAAMLLIISSVGFWTSLAVFTFVVIGNAMVQSAGRLE